MLKIDHEMFLEAMRVLRDTDNAELSQQILEKDKAVDVYEQDVRKKVLTHCAVRGAADIPEGMALVTVVIDIERIGDYIKNIVHLAANYPPRLQGGVFEPDLQRLEAAVKQSFVGTRACLESSDTEAATRALQEYGWVRKLTDDCILRLIREEDRTISPGQAIALVLYFRWLRRINSHLHNLNTSVVNPFERIGVKTPGD
jgi:Na+/phosphate symporter